MSYSIQQVGPSLDLIEQVLVSISYFDRSEISVLVDGVETSAWEWAGSTENVINMVPPVLPGGVITILRTTDLAELRHIYAGGARFDRATLDESFRQILHIAQEASERVISGDFYLDLDLHGNRVKNIADATELGHAVTLRQLNEATGYDIQAQRALAEAARVGAEIAQGYAEGARDAAEAARDQAVSAVTGALQRTQNLGDLDDVVEARANLGLSAAAITPMGTGANQLLRLDENGDIPAGVGLPVTSSLLPYAKMRVVAATSSSFDTHVTELTDVATNASDVLNFVQGSNAYGQYDTIEFDSPGVWLVTVTGRQTYTGGFTSSIPQVLLLLNAEFVEGDTPSADTVKPGIEYSVRVTTAISVQAGDILHIQGYFTGTAVLARLA